MNRLIFHQSIPERLLPTVKEFFQPLEWMIPAWCREVTVYWQVEADDACALETRVNQEYRFAEMWVHPCWLEVPEEMKRENVIHEMIHLSVNPLYDYAQNTIGMLTKDHEVFKVHAQESLRRFCEGAVQDLADTVFRKLEDARAR